MLPVAISVTTGFGSCKGAASSTEQRLSSARCGEASVFPLSCPSGGDLGDRRLWPPAEWEAASSTEQRLSSARCGEASVFLRAPENEPDGFAAANMMALMTRMNNGVTVDSSPADK